MAKQTLTSRIEAALAQEANLYLAVQEAADRITVSGMVDSEEAHRTALRIVAKLAPGRQVVDDVEVQTTLPVEDADASVPPAGNFADTLVEIHDANEELVADFTGSPGTTDDRRVVQDAEQPYFAPTDPVVGSDNRGNLEVIGGWSGTSIDRQEVAPSAADATPGDEALAEAVRRELREDAATTALEVRVTVRNGVVHLRGVVSDLVDAENAEAVAAGVPGVLDVVEELDVQAS